MSALGRQTCRRHLLLALACCVGWILAAPLMADPDKVPPGHGKYILVLRDAGSEGQPIVVPDIAKLGGKEVARTDKHRVITLPLAAAKQLRKDPNVAYLQRVWLGESFEGWNEKDSDGPHGLRANEDADPDLTWQTGTYLYDGSGNIKKIGADTYTYDAVGRLIQADVKGKTETYRYDAFGNLIEKTIVGESSTVPPIDSTSNRLAGEEYDAAGNLTTNRRRPAYSYDSLGMMSVNSTVVSVNRRMIYTADDERIGMTIAPPFFPTMLPETRWRFRDINNGQVLREFNGETGNAWVWLEDYVYSERTLVGGEREAYYGGKLHYHLDHLGTVRMITNENRLRYGVHNFYPFGVEQTSAVQENVNFGYRNETMKFTGHERDFYGFLNVDNRDYLDYMHARYYDPTVGRFLSVDPVLDITKVLHEPQMWNRYSYVGNNPLKYVDANGAERQLPSYILNSSAPRTEGVGKDVWIAAGVFGGALLAPALPSLVAEGITALLGNPLRVAETGVAAVELLNPNPTAIGVSADAVLDTGRMLQRAGAHESKMLAALKSHLDATWRPEASRALFKGIPKTEQGAEQLVRSIIDNRVDVVRMRKYIEIYDGSGRGVRLRLDGSFETLVTRTK